MKKQLCIVSVLACLFVNKLNAQEKELDEVVVTATKFKESKKNVGKIVYKITEKEIENAQGKTIVDLLNDVPGVEINGNYSTKGQNLGYYIRGGRNKQVAILINGVAVNDPSSFGGDFDLRQIDINQVENIEILKGAASTLYGTGAATGVINITLKKSSNKEFSGTFTTSLGTNRASNDSKIAGDELLTNFNFNGTLGKLSYVVGLNSNGSKGLSAIENSDKTTLNKEDVFTRKNALVNLNYAVNSKFSVGAFGSFDTFSSDFDGWGVDADNNLESKQHRVGVTSDFNYTKGTLKIRTFLTETERNETPSLDIFEGKAYGFDVFNNYKINSTFSFLIGLTAQYQDMYQKTAYSVIEEGEGKQHFYDPYVTVNYNSDYGFNFSAGTRLNMHSEYGNNMVFNVNPSYNFTLDNSTVFKVFASYSTAFVTPTLSEIFSKLPTINELLPEENTTIEGGFTVDFNKNISANATYFYREETNKIGYDPTTYQVINDLGTFAARGFETEISYKPTTALQLLANYGYVDRDENLLLKIPQHKIGVRANYQVLPSTFASINYKYVADTKDFGDVVLPSYNLVDFFINHKVLHNRVTLFGSVTNIFNADYQEIAGYSTRGRNYNLGLKISL